MNSEHPGKIEPVSHLHPTVRAYLENPRIAAEYDEYFSGHNLFRFDCKFLLQELPASCRVLDAGCGSGRHLVFLAERGYEVHGLDLSEHFLETARRKLLARNLPVRLRHGDIMNPPYPPGTEFDGIILMFSVLGMVCGQDNRREVLRRLSLLLARGGRIILHVHNRRYGTSAVLERLAALRGMLPDSGGLEKGDRIMRNYRGILDLYLHSFSLPEILQCLEDAGLVPHHVFGLNAARDGFLQGRDIDRAANGFLICATRRL